MNASDYELPTHSAVWSDSAEDLDPGRIRRDGIDLPADKVRYAFEPRMVAVDNIVYREIEEGDQTRTQIYLIFRQGRARETNKWALPGGFMNTVRQAGLPDETVEYAAGRETLEETGYTTQPEIFTILDSARRRGEVEQKLSFVCMSQIDVDAQAAELLTPGEVQRGAWFDTEALPQPQDIAFDHALALELFRQHLQKPIPLAERLFLYRPQVLARLGSLATT
jgi:ADP-ribose pyrophosphatase YjhB (NUDIX family)